jgi:DNA polymerase elongation subunit (family B)
MEKIKVGYKICRYAQFPEEKGRAIMPSILEELLAARKATRKLAEKETDDFMKNVFNKFFKNFSSVLCLQTYKQQQQQQQQQTTNIEN